MLINLFSISLTKSTLDKNRFSVFSLYIYTVKDDLKKSISENFDLAIILITKNVLSFGLKVTCLIAFDTNIKFIFADDNL